MAWFSVRATVVVEAMANGLSEAAPKTSEAPTMNNSIWEKRERRRWNFHHYCLSERFPLTRLINMSKGGHVDLNSLSRASARLALIHDQIYRRYWGKKLPSSAGTMKAGRQAGRFVPQSPWNCTWGPWRFRLGRYRELSHLLLLLSSLNRLFVGHLCNSLTQFGVIRNVEKIGEEKRNQSRGWSA